MVLIENNQDDDGPGYFFLLFFVGWMYVGGRHPERGNLFPSRTGSAVFNQVFATAL